jgi:hypothetical protein
MTDIKVSCKASGEGMSAIADMQVGISVSNLKLTGVLAGRFNCLALEKCQAII